MARAAAVIDRSGEVMPRASTWVTPSASRTATGSVYRGGQSRWTRPYQTKNDDTATVTATSTPSFALIERNGSSGRGVTI
jgi:hypothetical protein